MSITPNEARDRFVARCDQCGTELALAVGDLTDGIVRGLGWRPVGHNEHQCAGCVQKAARKRRAKAARPAAVAAQ